MGLLLKPDWSVPSNNPLITFARLLHIKKNETHKTATNDYTSEGHASKLSEKQPKTESSFTNFERWKQFLMELQNLAKSV